MSRRRTIINIAILAAIVLVVYYIGASLYGYFTGKNGHKGMPPAPVEVAKAEQQQWQDQIHSTGTISAIEGVMIRPEVSGRITHIYFISGTDVKKGDPLFEIYPDILEAQLKNNQAALDLAQVNYDRAAALYAKKVVSKESLDQYTSGLQEAQATLEQTKANLVQHNIVAPFSGRIGLKQVDVGDYVTAGANLVELQQMNPLRVQYSVPDNAINKLKIGDKAWVTASSMPNTIFKGTVYAFNSAVELDTRSFSMWAKIPNPDDSLIPGTYVGVTMFVGTPHPVIAVPQTAALFSPMGQYVYKVVDNKAVKTQITVGERLGNLIEIKSGLKAGDLVITAGQVKVFDGSSVIPMPSKTYPPEKAPQEKVISSEETDTATSPEANTVSAKPKKNANGAPVKTSNTTPTAVSPNASSNAPAAVPPKTPNNAPVAAPAKAPSNAPVAAPSKASDATASDSISASSSATTSAPTPSVNAAKGTD
jgi:membrane fusion protein (multidrug efflux system)